MILNAVKKVFGSRNQRLIKKHRKIVNKINALEPEFEALDDEQLAAKTQEFRSRLKSDDNPQGETIDQLLPEAFAVMREAGKRALGMRPRPGGLGTVLLPGRSAGLHRPELLRGDEEQVRRQARPDGGLPDAGG